MSNELKVAIQAAKKGANYAMQFFGKDLAVDKKEDNTVVTKLDKETEEVIKKAILSKFPNAKFVGEETGGIPTKGAFWTIDPIDGTRHFIRKTPLWAVLISLIVDGQPVLGVSNMPYLNEITYAQKGKGAFLNSKKVKVSNISNLKDAIFMFGSLGFLKIGFLPFLKLLMLVPAQEASFHPTNFICSLVEDVKLWWIHT